MAEGVKEHNEWANELEDELEAVKAAEVEPGRRVRNPLHDLFDIQEPTSMEELSRLRAAHGPLVMKLAEGTVKRRLMMIASMRSQMMSTMKQMLSDAKKEEEGEPRRKNHAPSAEALRVRVQHLRELEVALEAFNLSPGSTLGIVLAKNVRKRVLDALKALKDNKEDTLAATKKADEWWEAFSTPLIEEELVSRVVDPSSEEGEALKRDLQPALAGHRALILADEAMRESDRLVLEATIKVNMEQSGRPTEEARADAIEIAAKATREEISSAIQLSEERYSEKRNKSIESLRKTIGRFLDCHVEPRKIPSEDQRSFLERMAARTPPVPKVWRRDELEELMHMPATKVMVEVERRASEAYDVYARQLETYRMHRAQAKALASNGSTSLPAKIPGGFLNLVEHHVTPTEEHPPCNTDTLLCKVPSPWESQDGVSVVLGFSLATLGDFADKPVRVFWNPEFLTVSWGDKVVFAGPLQFGVDKLFVTFTNPTILWIVLRKSVPERRWMGGVLKPAWYQARAQEGVRFAAEGMVRICQRLEDHSGTLHWLHHLADEHKTSAAQLQLAQHYFLHFPNDKLMNHYLALAGCNPLPQPIAMLHAGLRMSQRMIDYREYGLASPYELLVRLTRQRRVTKLVKRARVLMVELYLNEGRVGEAIALAVQLDTIDRKKFRSMFGYRFEDRERYAERIGHPNITYDNLIHLLGIYDHSWTYGADYFGRVRHVKVALWNSKTKKLKDQDFETVVLPSLMVPAWERTFERTWRNAVRWRRVTQLSAVAAVASIVVPFAYLWWTNQQD